MRGVGEREKERFNFALLKVTYTSIKVECKEQREKLQNIWHIHCGSANIQQKILTLK